VKLQPEFPEVLKRFELVKDQIPEYAEQLKATGRYEDFTTRLAWDCLHFTFRSNEICNWYAKHDCNDTHITTIAKKALKEVIGDINF
jgi:hypothetical protein